MARRIWVASMVTWTLSGGQSALCTKGSPQLSQGPFSFPGRFSSMALSPIGSRRRWQMTTTSGWVFFLQIPALFLYNLISFQKRCARTETEESDRWDWLQEQHQIQSMQKNIENTQLLLFRTFVVGKKAQSTTLWSRSWLSSTSQKTGTTSTQAARKGSRRQGLWSLRIPGLNGFWQFRFLNPTLSRSRLGGKGAKEVSSKFNFNSFMDHYQAYPTAQALFNKMVRLIWNIQVFEAVVHVTWFWSGTDSITRFVLIISTRVAVKPENKNCNNAKNHNDCRQAPTKEARLSPK